MLTDLTTGEPRRDTRRTERRIPSQSARDARCAELILDARNRAALAHPAPPAPDAAHDAMVRNIVLWDLAVRITKLEASERQLVAQLAPFESPCECGAPVTGHQLDAEEARSAALDLREFVNLDAASKPVNRVNLWAAVARLAAAVGLDELCAECERERVAESNFQKYPNRRT